jgi:ATP-binding cassette subfamily F protein uup
VRLGANIAMATLDQHRESLDPLATVSEALTGGHGDTVMIGGQSRHVVSYMKDFLFTAEQARTPLGVLSGGERGRLMLARALARPSNVLVLDEPTNDLDLETLDVLEEMLGDYAGTVILISHDRDFLDRVVSGVIVPEGSGRWQEYAGGYSDMLMQRGEDLKASEREPAKPAGPKQTKPTSGREPRQSKRRLSFHEKHALETLPKTIATLEAKIGVLNQRLHDPTLYARDRAAFDAASADLASAQSDLTAAEERWLELEILRDQVDSG